MITLNFNPIPKPKCKHCGKPEGSHRAKTNECLRGMKTRVGYTEFGPTVYKPKEVKKK